MKKHSLFPLILLTLAFSFLSVGCDSAKIEVGEKDELAYIRYSQTSPEIVLTGETERKITDEELFAMLVNAVDGKTITDAYGTCDCESSYNIRIDKYTFRLHTHGIEILSRMGFNIKGVNYIGMVDCTEEDMNALFVYLANMT